MCGKSVFEQLRWGCKFRAVRRVRAYTAKVGRGVMHEQPPYPKSSSSAVGKSALKYMYKAEFDQVGKAAA